MSREFRMLDVFDAGRLVGTLQDTSPMSFAYAQQWLSDPGSYALAGLPLQFEPMSTPAVEAFFENLLPEGMLRDLLGKKFHASRTFSFLSAVAGDTAGGLTILPSGMKPEAPSYRVVDWAYIARYFSGGLQTDSVSAPLGSRISLSGAQAKMLIDIDASGSPMLPIGHTPSRWIVKPNIRGFEQVWNSAVNEAIVMRAAHHCGLGVAEVFFEPTTQACVVKRFDRTEDAEGAVERLAQFDFCQLSGLSSGQKYEAEGGLSLSDCADLIRKRSVKPAVDLSRLCQWVFFNLYTGNNDSHAKNLALVQKPGEGFRLAPFYDLMNTRLYPGLSGKFAFRIGGEDQPGQVGHAQIVQMAQDLKLKPTYVLATAKAVYAKLGPALSKAILEFQPQLDASGNVMATKLQQHITSLAKKTVARLSPSGTDQLADSEETDFAAESCEACRSSPCVCEGQGVARPVG